MKERVTLSPTCEGWAKRARDRGGFILPMTMFILMVLTVLAVGAFFIGSQESLMATATKNAELAFYVAERGIVEVISGWDGDTYGALNALDTASATDTLSDGRYVVNVTRTSGNMFLLDVTSYITVGGLLREGAGRRLGYVVRTVAPDIDPPTSAVMTRGAMSISATSRITGADDVPSALTSVCLPSDGTTVEGVVAPDTSVITLGAVNSSLGDPAKYQSSSIDTTWFTDLGGLDWTELTALANHTISGGSYTTAPDTTSRGRCTETTSTNWGRPTGPDAGCGLYFPIVHVTGNLRLNNGSVGQGILLVDDDMTVLGNFTFYGLIIVQGTFDSSGTNSIYGSLMSKNEDNTSQAIGGTTRITYSQCTLNRAIGYSAAGIGYPIEGRSWVDLTSAIY
jgi:hypothetical protein